MLKSRGHGATSYWASVGKGKGSVRKRRKKMRNIWEV